MGKFKIYFIFISLFSCLCICNKVSAADSLPSNIWEVFESDMSESNYNFDYDYFQSFVENNSLFSVCRYEQTNYIVYYFTRGNVLKLENHYSSINSGSYYFQYSGARYIATTNNTWSYNGKVYLATVYIGLDGTVKAGYSTGDSWGTWNTASSMPIYYNSSVIANTNLLYRNYQGSKNSFSHSGIPTDEYYAVTLNFNNDYFTYYDFYFANASNNLYLIGNEWDEQFPVSVQDDRLSIYTGVSLKGPALFIDCNEIATDFELDNNGFQSMSMQPHSYTLTLDCDGVSVSYVVDAQNSKWVDSYTSRTYITDFEIDSYNNVKVVSVSFSLEGINQRGTFTEDYYISTDVYLKKSTEDSGASVITNPDYDNDNITEEEITTIINNLNIISSSHSNGTWQFLYDLPSLPSWATVYEFSLAYNTLDSVSYADRFYYYPYSEGDLHIDLESILNDSVYRLYDVILIDVYSGEWGADPIFDPPDYVLDRYLVFYTDKYYTRQNGYSISDILKLIKNDVDNSILFYEYVKLRLDDFENKVLIKFDSSNTYLSSINVWTQVLNNGVNSLHTDLQNILTSISNMQFPTFDDSNIITSIDNVITALGGISGGDSSYSLPSLSNELKTLFIPSFEWQDLNYEDYMESLGVLALPFEFTFDVLDIAENQYSSDLELHLDSLSIPIPDGLGGNVQFDVFQETDYTFSPTQIIDSTTWSMLQYLNLFLLVIVQAGSTFLLIFGKGENET